MDADFCAQFIKVLHTQGTPGFHTLNCYDKVRRDDDDNSCYLNFALAARRSCKSCAFLLQRIRSPQLRYALVQLIFYPIQLNVLYQADFYWGSLRTCSNGTVMRRRTWRTIAQKSVGRQCIILVYNGPGQTRASRWTVFSIGLVSSAYSESGTRS